jgi:prophage regulatory protein
MTFNILRLPEVKQKTGLSRSSIYAMVANDTFPKPVQLGTRAVGWLENEISDWINQKAQMRGIAQ